MQGLDTNILVRIATRDDAGQLRKVKTLMRELFSREQPAWVSIIVVTELSWVLGRRYEYSRDQIGHFLETLLKTDSILVEDEIRVGAAIDIYRKNTADFSDCLILVRNQAHSVTPTHTLDRKAAKIDGFELL